MKFSSTLKVQLATIVAWLLLILVTGVIARDNSITAATSIMYWGMCYFLLVIEGIFIYDEEEED